MTNIVSQCDPFSEKGYSLIEMLIVLSIVSMVSILGFSSFRTISSSVSIYKHAQNVSFVIKNIRLEAINSNSQSVLTVDLARRNFANNRGNIQYQLPADVKLTVTSGEELIRENDVVDILFFADGSSSGGAMSFAKNNHKSISIEIPWLTGIPTINRISDE